jgi:SNARE associated Golgi protein
LKKSHALADSINRTGARVFFLSDVGRQLAFASIDGIAIITSQLMLWKPSNNKRDSDNGTESINCRCTPSVATLRAIPIAPFTVINIISGVFQVPVRGYLLGSLIGLAPGIILTNLFAHQLQSAMRNPGVASFVLLAVLIVISVLGTLWLRRKFSSTT